MQIDILTLFPDMFTAPLGDSIIGRAGERGLVDIRCHQIRDYTTNKQNQVDDYPYGGGQGCVMMAQPLMDCWRAVSGSGGPARTIYFSPRGKVFTQADAVRLAEDYDRLILVCGHYEGVDQRFIDAAVDEEISLGDFVLTGGEIPAMALADAVCRMVPGVLSDESCFTEESHWSGVLEYPQYTRPEVWEGQSVPEVLRSGDHGAIAGWRRKQALLTTFKERPDMFDRLIFSKADLKLLGQLREETDDPEVKAALAPLHTGRITLRPTGERDEKGFKALHRSRGEPVSAAYTYVRSLELWGISDCSIYADGLGFCGHCAYNVEDGTAWLRLEMLPYTEKTGVDTYAMAHILDMIFTETDAADCDVEPPLSKDLRHRIGFSRADTGHYTLTRTAWQKRRQPWTPS